MIPFVAVVSLRNQESRTFRLWIPLFLGWFLLLPLGILLSPFIFIACLVSRVNPLRGVAVMWQILNALTDVNPLRGVAVMWQILNALTDTELEVEHRSAGMSFHFL